MDLAELLVSVEAACRAAGDEILALRGRAAVVRDKGRAGKVTEADLAATRVLEDRLRSLLPDAGWLCEESEDDPTRLERSLCWVVDPLDGTRHFAAGSDEFAVSVALVQEGHPVLGVVFQPARDRIFPGVRTPSDTRLGRQLLPPSGPADSSPSGPVLVSGGDRSRGRLDGLGPAQPLLSMGSTALKLALVAAGEAAATLTPRPRSEWDTAAGALLVELAGGLVTDGSGAVIRFNLPHPEHTGLLAARSAAVHRSLLELLPWGEV